jgi:hypothetical protein
VGIGIALFLEWRRKKSDCVGMGISGAIIVNICASLALLVWLTFGDLPIPLRGKLILWGLIVIILGVTITEIIYVKKSRISK